MARTSNWFKFPSNWFKFPSNLQVRGALANIAPVAASAMVIGGTLLLYGGNRWTSQTEEIRATGIVSLTIICALLMGLGMFYLWQLLVKRVDVRGPGGFRAGIEVAEDTDQSPSSTSAVEDLIDLQEMSAPIEPGRSGRPPLTPGQ